MVTWRCDLRGPIRGPDRPERSGVRGGFVPKPWREPPAVKGIVPHDDSPLAGRVPTDQEAIVKWTGLYLVGFLILLGGLLAALWKLGILASIGTTWTLIGVAIAVGVGIMIAVSNSGAKENIEINRK
jgi:hypothetical protein